MQSSEFSGYSIYTLTTVDSTNNYTARPEIQSKLPHKAVIMAEHQLQGKGQLTNKWESEYGKNLLFSIFIKPDLPVKDQFVLGRVAALAIKDTVAFFLNKEVFIKWPNDIFVERKKIAGILIENSIFGSKINRSIIGIGININQMRFKTGDFNSFKLILNKEFDRNRVLEYLLYRFSKYYDQIGEKADKIKENYDNSLYEKGELRSFKTPDNKEFKARISGTTHEGKLNLILESGELQSFDHKMVFFS